MSCELNLAFVAGSLVFEEDEMGDAMYVILCGQCQIRARPAHAATIPQQQSLPVSSLVVDKRRTDSTQSTDSDSSGDEEDGKPATAPARVVRSDSEHSASFWIHKYMQQVQIQSCLFWAALKTVSAFTTSTFWYDQTLMDTRV